MIFLALLEWASKLSHRVDSGEFNPEGVVNDSVEDSIGDSWVGDVPMPISYCEL